MCDELEESKKTIEKLKKQLEEEKNDSSKVESLREDWDKFKNATKESKKLFMKYREKYQMAKDKIWRFGEIEEERD